MRILIESVPNEQVKKRRGFGGADWWWDALHNYHELRILVAYELRDDEQICLIVHELVEALLCKWMCITTREVDDYDLQHLDDEKDPAFNSGDQKDSPYRIPHMFATAAERIVAGAMGVDWTAYDEHLSAL
jgi:hypothetical protein